MTTPPCAKCGNRDVVRLSSCRFVYCPDCNTDTPWPLKEGQAPLINSQRGDRKK